MTFRSWMKDWIINNPKFFILVVIVVTVIIIFTVVTFIQIGIEANAVDTASSFYKDFSTNFKDMGPNNFPTTFGDMDSRTTKIIWNPEQPPEKP